MSQEAANHSTACQPKRGAFAHRRHLLASPFRYAHRRVLFGKARLYGDRIELLGWTFKGRYRRCIPFDEVKHLEYHTLQEDAALTFFLNSDNVVSLHLHQAQQWRVLFEHWRHSNIFTRARFYDGLRETPAFS